MEALANDAIMSFVSDEKECVRLSVPGLPIARSNGHVVASYIELLQKVASLSYLNPRFKLLFRGQSKDYKLNRRGEQGDYYSSLYPSLLRPLIGEESLDHLKNRFDRLHRAESLLKDHLRKVDILHNQYARWAILQHYEVCQTPLLDATSSLQSALSFAIGDNGNEGYLFVLAFPQLSGPVSVSWESKTLVIDLAQMCSPEALRPHFQSGMLVGDFPSFYNFESLPSLSGLLARNFSCRLLTKFHLTNCESWKVEGFSAVPQSILFPNCHDRWFSELADLKSRL